MATPNLSPSFVIGILATKAVKADLQARGIRLSYVSPRDIRMVANEYLAAHPELMAQAEQIFRELGYDRARNGMARRTTVSQAS
jgi:hypothetical protein